MDKIFESYIDNAFDGYHQAEFKFYQFALNYRSFFPRDKQAYVLDIGVGRGEMLSCMREWGYVNYEGIDISPSTVQFCNKIGLKCKVVNNTSKYLSERYNRYSIITLLDVLEHVKKEDIINFLSAIRNALIPNGVVIIQVPNLQAPDGQLHRYNDITHEVGYIEHSLYQVLTVARFNEIKFYGFDEFYATNLITKIKKILRLLFWLKTRVARTVAGNLNPKILHPVFFAVAKK